MLENFIYAKNKFAFRKELEAGNILDEAIVFIEDTKEIWNHGTYFNGSYIEDLEEIRNKAYTALLEKDIAHLETQQHASDTYALKTEIPTKISELEKDINYVQDNFDKNGVYVLNKDNLIIDYNHGDETCKGVVVILDDIKLLISKLLFDKATWKNRGGMNKTAFVDGICTTEIKEEALLDFLGFHNTEKIFLRGASTSSLDMCNLIYDYNMGVFGNNEGFNDWYIPALGLLNIIYLNKEHVNNALTKIGGSRLGGPIWSSTLASSNGAWLMDSLGSAGSAGTAHKVLYSYKMIAIRDIQPNTIEKRISSLENNHIWSILDLNIYIPKIPTFIYDGTRYEFYEGMTWSEWIDSEYNTIYLRTNSSGYVVNTAGHELRCNGRVTKSDTIIENGNYIYYD